MKQKMHWKKALAWFLSAAIMISVSIQCTPLVYAQAATEGAPAESISSLPEQAATEVPVQQVEESTSQEAAISDAVSESIPEDVSQSIPKDVSEEAAETIPESTPAPFTLETKASSGTAAGALISQQSFHDSTSLLNFIDLLGGGRTLSLGVGQVAHAEGTNGDALFFYSAQERSVVNGVTTVALSTGSAYRCGVLFRAVDADNYSWAGFDNSGTLRIREKVGAQEDDIMVTGLSVPQQFGLRVEYWQDDLKVFANDTQLYSGPRPLKNKFGAQANAPADGKSGLMGWSVFSANFDDLCVYEYAPTVTGVKATGLSNAQINGTDIQLTFTAQTDLSAVELQFECAPQIATASPAGAQDLSGGAVAYTLSLPNGGNRVYQVTATQPEADSYLNPFDGSDDKALIDSLQDIHGDASGIQMLHKNGWVRSSTNVGSGNHLWMDTNSPSAKNGAQSVVYQETQNQWRTGILLRAQDAKNFTWIALQSNNSLRIRECIDGVEKDILQSVVLPGSQFTLKAYYFEDELLVYADNAILYQGKRPFVKEGSALQAGTGQIGMMGWDRTETAFDDLSYEAFRPFVTGAQGDAVIESNQVTITVPRGTDLKSYTPGLVVFPQNAAVTPAGPQDFSTTMAQQNGIVYTLTATDSSANPVTAQYVVKVTTGTEELAVLENSDMRVELSKEFPAVYSYQRKPEGTLFGGAQKSQKGIKINGTAYTPDKITFTQEEAEQTVRYQVALSNVSIGGQTKALSFDVAYSLSGATLSMVIENVVGDIENQRLQIALDAPVITLAQNEPNAKIAYGGAGGSSGGEVKTITGSTLNRADVSWPFLAGGDTAVAVYTQDQWNRPYTVKITGGKGEVWSDGYYHRLTDGVRPVKDTANGGATQEIVYRQTVYLCGDTNGDGVADWQDAALWTRTQIPQMPQAVRDFFNGGGWAQTHAAFPGNGQAGYVGNYKGFTTVYSEMNQIVEAQRQIYNMTDKMGKFSFEVVGWNGRGHDYGWPNINEVTFNPALGTETEFRAAQEAIRAYNGDLSFHTNMSDMTDNSASYLRNTAQSPFGNRTANTGQASYGSNVFGWNAWFVSHFKDLPYALNRQDAFIGANGRFLAPQFIYSDVMLDKPSGAMGTTAADEQYAKFRLTDHYQSLGSSLATEYYYSEKRTGGLYLMKNYSNPSLVDQFINAGQTIFNDTRNVNVQAQDYIWASLYSDTARDGNFNVASSGTGNYGSMMQVEQVLLLGYVNGYVAQNKLEGYHQENGAQYTQWGNNVRYRVSGNQLVVTQGDNTVASLTLSGGKISGDCFVPAYHDNSNRIFAFSSNGGTKTWTVPSEITANAFKLYRLTESGRVFAGDVVKTGTTVSFAADPGYAYVLEYSAAQTPDAEENMALTAKITSSSNQQRASWQEDAKGIPVSTESLYVKKGDLTGNENDTWSVGSDLLLRNLTTAMMQTGDARYLRYHHFIISGFAADGIANTYWMPAANDTAPTITFQFAAQRNVASFRLDYTTDSVSGPLEIQLLNESGQIVYTGAVKSGTAYALPSPAATGKITLRITNADGAAGIRLQEAALYSKVK